MLERNVAIPPYTLLAYGNTYFFRVTIGKQHKCKHNTLKNDDKRDNVSDINRHYLVKLD